MSAQSGRFDGRLHRFALRVYFEDTDLTGVVYHANYLRYFERARSDMLALVGVDQRGTFDAGTGAYAVSAVALRYKAPARLSDELIVESWLARIRGVGVHIHQRVIRGSTIVAEAEVEAVFVAPNGRPRRQPAEWVAAFEPYLFEGT